MARPSQSRTPNVLNRRLSNFSEESDSKVSFYLISHISCIDQVGTNIPCFNKMKRIMDIPEESVDEKG